MKSSSSSAEAQQLGEQHSEQLGEQLSEAIVGDTSLLVLCAFLAVVLQFWEQSMAKLDCTC